MKIISKVIENRMGISVGCWKAVSGDFSLSEGLGSVSLHGYKDVSAFQSGKEPIECKTVHFDLSAIETFESVWTEIANKLISTGELAGGSIVDA